jgi:hypothetical protein
MPELRPAESGCLVIADISGYTEYLPGSELEHAQDVLADLTASVVGALRPVLRLSALEGDAAFAYALPHEVDAFGTLLLTAELGATEGGSRLRVRFSRPLGRSLLWPLMARSFRREIRAGAERLGELAAREAAAPSRAPDLVPS